MGEVEFKGCSLVGTLFFIDRLELCAVSSSPRRDLGPDTRSVGFETARGRSPAAPCRHSRKEHTSMIGKWVSLLCEAFRSNKEGACHILTGS